MARWIPTEVVVHHSVELILQVDAFAEAVSGHQYSARGFAQIIDALLAVRRRQETSHGGNLYVGELALQT
jgi:hypothetical protein